MLVLSDDVENKDFPIVNWLIIFLNVLIFLLLTHSGQENNSFFKEWGTVPYQFLAHPDLFQYRVMFSSMFLHLDYLHIIGNMWVLYLFGDNVEDRLGHFTYLLFYLVCGIIADIIHILSDPYSTIPTVGASGAIAGVMGAYVIMHPNAKCNTWWGDDSIIFAFRTIKIPAGIIIFGWFFLQIISSVYFAAHSNIAFYAHVGGFLAGISMLCFVKYREYGSNTNEQVSHKGAVPGLCLMAFMVLIWGLMHQTPSSKTMAAQTTSIPTAPMSNAQPIAAKPGITANTPVEKTKRVHAHNHKSSKHKTAAKS